MSTLILLQSTSLSAKELQSELAKIDAAPEVPGSESSSTETAADEHASPDEDHAMDETSVPNDGDAVHGEVSHDGDSVYCEVSHDGGAIHDEVDHGSAVTEERPMDPGYVPEISPLQLFTDDDEDFGGLNDDELRAHLLSGSDGCDVSGNDFRTNFILFDYIYSNNHPKEKCSILQAYLLWTLLVHM